MPARYACEMGQLVPASDITIQGNEGYFLAVNRDAATEVFTTWLRRLVASHARLTLLLLKISGESKDGGSSFGRRSSGSMDDAPQLAAARKSIDNRRVRAAVDDCAQEGAKPKAAKERRARSAKAHKDGHGSEPSSKDRATSGPGWLLLGGLGSQSAEPLHVAQLAHLQGAFGAHGPHIKLKRVRLHRARAKPRGQSTKSKGQSGPSSVACPGHCPGSRLRRATHTGDGRPPDLRVNAVPNLPRPFGPVVFRGSLAATLRGQSRICTYSAAPCSFFSSAA